MSDFGCKKQLQDLLQQYIEMNYQPAEGIPAEASAVQMAADRTEDQPFPELEAASSSAANERKDRILYDIPLDDADFADGASEEPKPRAKRGFSYSSSAEKSIAGKDALFFRHKAVHAIPAAPVQSGVEAYLAGRDEGFRDMLLRLIDSSGLSDPDCYRAAGLTRQHFGRIKSDPDYRPKKATAVALGMALKLDRQSMDELLLSAGYALSRSSYFDLIIAFCIERGIYSIDAVNDMLYSYDQELLGAR